MRQALIFSILLSALLAVSPMLHAAPRALTVTGQAAAADAKDDDSLEAQYKRRFPQPATVGHLIGLPVLDDDDVTLGHVEKVVRTPEGKIELIVSYSKWFGWFGRPVAVPLEAVTILALPARFGGHGARRICRGPNLDAGQGHGACRQRHRARRAGPALVHLAR